MDDRHDFAAAVERLRRHLAAKTDGECPYRTGPDRSWDADQYRWDCEAVIVRYLADHPTEEDDRR